MAKKALKEFLDSRKLQDVNAARNIFEKFMRADDTRRTFRVQVRNQLEGGRPMSQEDLDENDEGWRSNFNPRDAETAEGKTLLPYWEARNNTPRLINPIVHSGSKKSDRNSDIFAECFNLFHEDWGIDGEIEGRLMDKQYVRFGPGYMFWSNKTSPRCESISSGRILLAEDTRLQMGKWDVVCVRDSISAASLAKHLRTKKSRDNAKFLGWNLETIMEVIRNADTEQNNVTDPRDDEAILDEINANTIVSEKLWPEVKVVYIYIKEEEGKIGKYMFTEKPGGTDDPDNDVADDFLFVKQDYEESFDKIIGMILYDVANGKMHGVKGFGIRNFDWSNVLARLKNNAVDGAMFSGMNFQNTGDLENEGPPVENYGIINVFPPGLTLLREQPNNENGLRMIQFLENNMDENNSIYKETGSLIAQSETARQADLLAGISNKVELINILLYLKMYAGSIYSEQFRRLRMKGNEDEDAVLFKERCLERGMSKEVFHDTFVVVLAGNDASGGNPASKDQLWLDTLTKLIGKPGIDQDWLLRNFISARHGARAVEKAMLPQGSETDKFGARMAKVENHMMSEAVPMDVISQDDHIAHIPVHMQPVEQIVQKFIDDGKLEDQNMVIYVQLGMAHIDKHFAHIKGDETLDQQRKPLEKKWKQIKKVAEDMVDQFARAKEEQDKENNNQ